MNAFDVLPQPDLSVVVPVYRSENCLNSLVAAITEALASTGIVYEVILVNDYSPDGSWLVIQSLCRDNQNIVGVDLRRNFGQDNAILTGLRLARGEFIAIMDDDLQHHPKYLPELLRTIKMKDSDVVYADFRSKQQKPWKNLGSWFNGKIAEWVIYKPKHIYLSPYKVVRKDVAELLCTYQGPKPYIDGLLFLFTSRITQLPVEHYPRHAGESSYTLWKAIGVATRLAFSFSVRPLRIISWCGFMLAGAGLLLALFVALYRIFFPEHFTIAAAGWTSLMVTFLLVSGIQMIFFGVLGEYSGRTYLRVSNNPQTSIREVVNSQHSDADQTGMMPYRELSFGDQPDL